jgi:hypothetical protein
MEGVYITGLYTKPIFVNSAPRLRKAIIGNNLPDKSFSDTEFAYLATVIVNGSFTIGDYCFATNASANPGMVTLKSLTVGPAAVGAYLCKGSCPSLEYLDLSPATSIGSGLCSNFGCTTLKKIKKTSAVAIPTDSSLPKVDRIYIDSFA